MSSNHEIPELLFHTVLTVIDFHTDTSGSTRTTYVLGTHINLKASKAFALKALPSLGYEPDDFETYETHSTSGSSSDTVPDTWKHGDGVMVYAKAPAGQEFLVSLDTTPNNEKLYAGGADDTPKLPSGCDHLHYVLQTKTDYNQDKSGAFQTTDIEGCYVHRAAALKAAREALSGLGGRDAFSQYDERDDEREQGQWPFGDEVIVHAVAETGENYSISVRTPPGAHKRFHKKR